MSKQTKTNAAPPLRQEEVFEEEKSAKSRFRVVYIFLILAVFAFAVYAGISLLNIHSQLRQRREELAEINSQIKVQEIKNEEMSKLYNYSDEEFSDYVEQIARDDLDYVKSGERVFVNVSGD